VPLGFSFRFGIQAVMRIYFAFEMWEVKSSSIKGSSFRPDSRWPASLVAKNRSGNEQEYRSVRSQEIWGMR
jgi:hypothetical protein